ncbi:MAG TPA: hypothetical protein VLB02_02355, partial [Candidatus Paceibacterota bacterium]|nr:hypothetical protein [Candidatus Paceibacterota bacterium]
VGLVLIIPSFISVNLRHRLASEQYAAIAESGSFASDEDLAATAAAIALLKSAYAADSTFSVLAALDAIVPPPGITITNISMASREGRSIEFSGISRDRATLQQFIAAAEVSAAVASGDHPVSNFVKNQNGEFKITVRFK